MDYAQVLSHTGAHPPMCGSATRSRGIIQVVEPDINNDLRWTERNRKEMIEKLADDNLEDLTETHGTAKVSAAQNTQYAIHHTPYATHPKVSAAQNTKICNTPYAIRNPPKSTVNPLFLRYCGCTIRSTLYALHSYTPLVSHLSPSPFIRNTQYARRFALQQLELYSFLVLSLYAIRCAIRNTTLLPQAVLRHTHFGRALRFHSMLRKPQWPYLFSCAVMCSRTAVSRCTVGIPTLLYQ